VTVARIRVLVVEDSLTVRKRLVEVITADPDLSVVGEAADGKRAIELCEALRPDVITLDMMMPVMTGLEATEHIMAYCPTPIIIVSSSTNRGELFRTYEALAAGAVDVLDKPKGDEQDDRWERKLISTVKLVSRIKVITHLRARRGPSRGRLTGPLETVAPAQDRYDLVVIGASTGGPNAIVEVLRHLPQTFPLPVLLVIHIGAPFGASFAEWLDRQSRLRVTTAVDGERLPAAGAARVIMAPPDLHLVLRGGQLRLTTDPERHSCRPSVDSLFESVARECGGRTIACLLTGMGRDGAEGMRAIQRAGGSTIAQDEATSVVFGMPREAIALGAADRVLPLPEIGPTLLQLGQTRRRDP
jgi:two-component system chemotaxis response regulator CheB